MNSMRNLEKLGILVIVILVVVVGVVAITPGEHLNRALDLPAELPSQDDTAAGGADANGLREVIPPVQPSVTPPRAEPGTLRSSGGTGPSPDTLDPWPEDRMGASEPAVDPRSGGLASNGQQPSAAPLRVPEPDPAPRAPAFRTYRIAKGDSLYRIAQRQLGSARHMGKIRALNPGVDPDRLQVGDELRLPVDPDAVAEQGTPRSRPAELRGPGGTYVVKKGDTLSDIAREQLGSATRWREIVRLNNDILHGSARIAPGMKLRMPGSPADGGGALASRNPAPSTERAYVVQKGDTLSDIARQELGSAGRWREIRDLNAGKLGGGNLLQVGMRLELPPR